MKKIIICLWLASTPLLGLDNFEYLYLDKLALEAGTDKSSNFHNYTEVYSELFASLRDKPIKFLEIGIYRGNSVKLWENYFPNGELHFIDITDAYIQHSTSRSYYHFLSQSDRNALDQFGRNTGGEFDVIIDDGGHTMNQQIISFQHLFPFVKSGGIYIIEDLHTSYWGEYGGNGNLTAPKAGQGTTVELLKNLVEDLNYIGAATGCADANKRNDKTPQGLNYYQCNIHSIQFFSSMCVIKKR